MQAQLGAYIPIDRCHALMRGCDLPDRTNGAVLFADISGFTPFTAALVQELGPRRGAEKLTSHMNLIYDALIAEVHRYGGSAIGFSGDAITCWFDGDAGLRSVSCGFAMLAAIKPLAAISTPSGALFTLAIKIAIAAGPARRFLVGDPQVRRLDVLAGQLLDIVATANRLASPGDILADVATIEHLGPNVAVQVWREDQRSGMRFGVIVALGRPADPAPWLGTPALSEDQAQCWLWPSVYKRLLRAPDQLLSELRPAVAMFLAFSGINYDQDDDAGLLLDAYIREVQTVVVGYEGNLVELTIGDKGSYLYICFGAPIAHNDDVVRAIAAGIDLCRPPRQLHMISGQRIGVAQGLMYTGIYGGVARRTYGILGDKVNLAARLMEHAAPGQICCEEQTYLRARHYWAFEALPSAWVKGRAEAIPVYCPGGQRAASPAPTEAGEPGVLVGRQAEVAQFGLLLDALAARGPQILLLAGEAGIGKSRLVAELIRLARERRVLVLQGAGQSIEQQTPYRAWRDILNAYFDLDERSDLAQRQAQVRRIVARAVPKQQQRLPLLNDILHLDLPETTLTAALDPELRKESLISFLLGLLSACSRERPLLLVIEDAHWLDSLSWMLVMQAARTFVTAGERLLLVLVTRPIDDQEHGGAHGAALQALERTTSLALTGLDPEETVAVAAGRLGLAPYELPEEVAAVVRQRAGGNPFFAEELALALRDQGLIAIERRLAVAGGQPTASCRITGDLGVASQALPDTLHGLILSRIDRLPPDRQLVLKVASAIGRVFAYTPLCYTLSQYTAIAEQTLRAHLDDLARRDLTVLEAVEPDLTYLFKHVITQEVAYQTLLFAQRKQIHRIVAGWYEHTFGEGDRAAPHVQSLSSFYPLLAYHYRHAEDTERERTYARLAGEQAAARYANVEALVYLDRALELTPANDIADRYMLLCAREKVYDLQGARARQRQDLEALAALAEALGDQRRAEVALRRSIFADHTGDPTMAVVAVQQCIELAHTIGRVDIEAAGYQWWGLILWAQGNIESRAPLERALALARDHGLEGLAAQSLAALGNLALLEGNCAEARDRYEQALLHYRSVGDRRGESTTINNLGITAHTTSDYSRARAYYEQALRLKRELGDRRGEGKALTCLGSLLASQGRYAAARDYYEQALQLYREIDGRAGESEVLQSLGGLTYQLGDLEAARTYSEQALQVARALSADDDQARALIPLGNALAGLQQPAAAAAAYHQALDIWRGLGLYNQAMAPLAGLARLALEMGEPLCAQSYVEEILAHLEQNTLDGADEPIQVYLTCFQVLSANHDLRAQSVLAIAYDLLHQQAAQIDDAELRRSFLENVAVHRAITRAFQDSLRSW